MAQPKEGVNDWMLERAKEYGIKSWKDKTDLSSQIYKAKKAAKVEVKSGFGELDKKATEVSGPAKEISATYTKIESPLPSMQKVDVSAPVINVHVPAPGVTVLGNQFSWWPVTCAIFSWLQAAVIGAALYAALSSRFGDVLALAVQ